MFYTIDIFMFQKILTPVVKCKFFRLKFFFLLNLKFLIVPSFFYLIIFFAQHPYWCSNFSFLLFHFYLFLMSTITLKFLAFLTQLNLIFTWRYSLTIYIFINMVIIQVLSQNSRYYFPNLLLFLILTLN